MNQALLRVLWLKVNLMNPFARPKTDQSELAAGHGRTVALLTVDPRRWTGRVPLEWLASVVV